MSRDDFPVSVFKWPAAFNNDLPISHVRSQIDYRLMNYDQAIWFNSDFADMANRVYDQSVGNLPDDVEVVVPGVRAALSSQDGMSWFKKIASRPPDSEFDCANHLEAVMSRILKYNTGINMFMLYDPECGVWKNEAMSWEATVGSCVDQIINNFGHALLRAAKLLEVLGNLAAPAPGPKPQANQPQAIKDAWNRMEAANKEMRKIVDTVEKMSKDIFEGKYTPIITALKRRMGFPQTAWDSDTRWIVLSDGAINVDEIYSKGDVRLYQFCPEYMTTMFLEVGLMDSIRNAGETEWDRGVAKVLPDPEVRRYLQKRFGGALLGRPGLGGKSMVWQYGVGDTAKSTLQECIAGSRGVFAPYAITSSSSALTKTGERTGAGERFKAYARGKRFAIMSELDDGEQLAQSDLKVMTGGESVEGTAKYANAVTYYFTATIFMASNHPPTFPPGDTAARGRIHVVPFVHKLFIRSKDPEGWEAAPPEHRADEGWADMVLGSVQERAAILRWVLDGLIAFGQESIGDLPQAMKDAAEEFAADADPVAKIVRSLLGEEPGYENAPVIKIHTDAEWKAYDYIDREGLTTQEAETLIEIRANELRLLKTGEKMSRKWMNGAKTMLHERGGAKKKVRTDAGSTAYIYSRVKLQYTPIGMD